MFSLIRNGPALLVLQTLQPDALYRFISESYEVIAYDFETALEKAKEHYTIVLMTHEKMAVMDLNAVDTLVVVKSEPSDLLCHLLSKHEPPLIASARMAPRILIMRAIGNLELVLKAFDQQFSGTQGSLQDLLIKGSSNSTLVVLTDKALNRTMSLTDVYPIAFKIDGKHHEILRTLRMHALNYLNAGIENKDWNEIEIRIFDRYSAYELHYERLLELFENLELGIVLGESWSKDYPRLFMAVEVYRVRFFTFHDPKYIKQLLLGLEYLEDGTRIVDYDVYVHHKKIDWTDAKTKEKPSIRHLLGLAYRAELLSKFSAANLETLRKLEEGILKTRI